MRNVNPIATILLIAAAAPAAHADPAEVGSAFMAFAAPDESPQDLPEAWRATGGAPVLTSVAPSAFQLPIPRLPEPRPLPAVIRLPEAVPERPAPPAPPAQVVAAPSTAPAAAQSAPAGPAGPVDQQAIPIAAMPDGSQPAAGPDRDAAIMKLWGRIDLTGCKTSPLTPEAVRFLVQSSAQAMGTDVALAMSVASAESAYGQAMISPAGALGIMQLMPGTAARYGVHNPCDPTENIQAGVRFLNDLLVEFGNPMLAMAAYNAGEGAVYQAGGIPLYTETAKYVVKIANEYYGLSHMVARSAQRGPAAPAPAPAMVSAQPSLQAEASAVSAAPATGQGAVPAQYRIDATQWVGGQVLYVR